MEGATEHITVSIDLDAGGLLKVFRGGTGGTLLASYTGNWTPYFWVLLQIKVKIHDTEGEVKVRYLNTEVLSFTGDTRNGGTAGLLDRFKLTAGLGSTNQCYFDDIIIRDDIYPGIGGLYVYSPTGAGSNGLNRISRQSLSMS